MMVRHRQFGPRSHTALGKNRVIKDLFSTFFGGRTGVGYTPRILDTLFRRAQCSTASNIRGESAAHWAIWAVWDRSARTDAARSARASRAMRPDPVAAAGTRRGPKTGPKTSKTRKITVSGAQMGPNAPNAPLWAPKRPKTGQNRRLSDTKMAISRARRKIGRGPGAENARRIQWNKKGRRSVSPILQNSVRNNSGEVGPLKSAEKQAKMGPKTAFLGRFQGFGPLGRGPGVKKREKAQKIKIPNPQRPQGHRE